MRRIGLPLWWLICFGLTHYNFGPSFGPQIPYLDKFVHATMYALLAAFYRVSRPQGIPPALAARFFVILIAYAAADEITQDWVGRDTEALDFAADACGAAFGLLFRRESPGRPAARLPA